ncbi:MAG: hypothetical protein RR332_03410 [Clostridiales bacterium]
MSERTELLRRVKQEAVLPMCMVAELLEVSLKSLYRKPTEPSKQETAAKRLI